MNRTDSPSRSLPLRPARCAESHLKPALALTFLLHNVADALTDGPLPAPQGPEVQILDGKRAYDVAGRHSAGSLIG